jgi:hypothetical protein
MFEGTAEELKRKSNATSRVSTLSYISWKILNQKWWLDILWEFRH